MEEYEHEQRLMWNERLVLAVESEDYEEAKLCKEELARLRQTSTEPIGASTGQYNDSPSPNAKVVPVQSYAMDADDYKDAWHDWHDLQETGGSTIGGGSDAPTHLLAPGGGFRPRPNGWRSGTIVAHRLRQRGLQQ